MLEMDKDATKVAVVLFDAVIELADVGLIQKSQYLFLELPASFPGDNFDEINFLVERLLHNPIQLGVNLTTAVVNVVQIEFEFCHVQSVMRAFIQSLVL